MVTSTPGHPAIGPTLTTKLIPPTKRSGLVDRRTLVGRLEQALAHRLVLVCAPAGYGKTTVLDQLLAQLRHHGRHVGWISLDESDKDLGQFIAYFVEAARRAGLRFGQGLSTLLGAGPNLPGEALKAQLLNDLASLEQDLYLLLDDYHLVTNSEIRELVNALLLSPLRHVHLVIAARSDSGLPLSRLRALGQVYEIDAADLMFSEHEVGEFVESIRGVPLTGPQIVRLREGTEGWAASLQMAGIAMRGLTDVDPFLDRFSGEHKSIGDFLGDEVLQRQPQDLQDFLIATSILRRFEAGLCNAVTGRSDGRAMLDEVERRNLFVFSLDPEHRWYRYHHLFADFLRRRLSERQPERVAELHRRACEWLAAHRLVTEAIEHAFHAEDMQRAGELLDASAADLFAGGKTATLASLTSRLPQEVLNRQPRLQLERAWDDVLRWKFDDATRALHRVEVLLDEGPGARSPEETQFLQGKLAHRWMMLALLSDDMPRTSQLAREWLRAAQTRDPFMCASAGSAVMAADRQLYRCEGTATSTRMLHDEFVRCGALYGVVFHQSIAGATFITRGELHAAQEALDRALEMAIELHGERSSLYGMPALTLAELYYERNQLRQAEEMLAERSLNTELGFVDNLVAGFVTRARLCLLRGRREEAENVLQEGRWIASHYGFRRLYAHLLHEQARQLAASGQLRELGRLLRDARHPELLGGEPAQAPRDGCTEEQELLALTQCRIWLEHGQAGDAAALLKSWLAFTRGRRCYRSAIRIGVLLVRAQLRLGERRAAQRTLMACLEMGEAGGFVRSFVDEGAELVDLLSELSRTLTPAEMLPAEYLASLLAAAESPDGPAAPRPVQQDEADTGSETLSERETRVLELGAHGLQNQDIAQAMCLAESTVKWYWQRVFDKLNVRRRADAIKKARRLNLVR